MFFPFVWVLIAIIIAFVLVGVFLWDDTYTSRVENAGIGLAVGVGVSTVAFFVFLGLAGYTIESSKVVEEHNVPLKSMSTTSEIHGQFHGSLFVQSGQIDQEAVYRFYGRNTNGSYTLATVTAGDSEVIEGDFAEPYATCYWEPAKNIPKIRGWFLAIDEDVWKNVNDASWCTFHIPTGSIADDFTLDTE